MGVNFEVMSTDVEETYDPARSPEEIVMHLSRLKLSPIDMSQYDVCRNCSERTRQQFLVAIIVQFAYKGFVIHDCFGRRITD